MKQELLDKYNVPVPRYTSYPPANYFHDGFTSRDYADAIRESNRQQPESVSFYFHIPFCQRLCHYCGCNSYAAPKPEIIDRYVAALHKEIDLILPLLDKKRKVSQIHYGGGTPTFLPAFELKELNAHVSDTFELIENPEKAIELREHYSGIEGAYHFNKKYWNSVRFDSDVDDKLMKELIDHSYDEVIKKFTKKLRAEYDALP